MDVSSSVISQGILKRICGIQPKVLGMLGGFAKNSRFVCLAQMLHNLIFFSGFL